MKKIISLLLIVIFLCSSLISCSDPSGDNTESTIEAPENVISETIEPVVLETVKLSDFVIVYKDFTNENVMTGVSLLKETIRNKTGIELRSKRAKEEEKYEFVVGDSGRDISNAYFSNLEENIKYQGYTIENGKIFIAGIDAYTLEKSIATFAADYLVGKDEITIESRKNGLTMINLEEEKLPPATDGTTLRFVSHNIIRMNLKYQAKAYRIDQLVALYGILDADILSLDECDEMWFSDFGFGEALEKIGYKLAPVGDKISEWDGNENCECRILFKESKFSLVASGCELFESQSSDEGVNWYGWALLEEKSSGKRFVAFSNHFWGNAQGKLKQAKQLLEYVKEIEARGYPVIISGDFNAHITDGSMQTLKAKLLSARHDAEVKVNMEYATCNQGGTAGPACLGNAIDHCFYSKFGVEAKRYETIIGYYGTVSSDHLPIILDFELK